MGIPGPTDGALARELLCPSLDRWLLALRGFASLLLGVLQFAGDVDAQSQGSC